MSTGTKILWWVSLAGGVAAMVYAGRPTTHAESIRTPIVLWASVPYLAIFLLAVSFRESRAARRAVLAGILPLWIGPVLILGASTWLGIDTRYDPVFLAVPLLQLALLLPFLAVAVAAARAQAGAPSHKRTRPTNTSLATLGRLPSAQRGNR